MPQLSPLRRRVALFALAFGGFGIGVTEFASMGLLPDIADELISTFAVDPQAGIATAGMLITAYALGVVVGAPVFAVLGARMSQGKLALSLLALLLIGNAASAFMPTFSSLVFARFVSGLPHGAYFGVASLLAARIMGPGMQGRGIALAMSGLTLANVFGVPLATWIGQGAGWRTAYLLVGAIFTLTFLISVWFVPRYPGDPTRSPLTELSAFRNVRVWIMIAVGSVGFGGFFAVYSYIAEVTTREAGLHADTVPWVLGCLGIGMTLGNVIGGWASDRNMTRTIVWGFSLFIASLAAYALFAASPSGLFITVFFVGLTSSALIPTIQNRLIRISHKSALLGAAVNHAAFNIGNSLGAVLGGLVIASGFGYLAPGWVGVALAVAGLALTVLSLGVQRKDRRRSIDTVGLPVVGDAD